MEMILCEAGPFRLASRRSTAGAGGSSGGGPQHLGTAVAHANAPHKALPTPSQLKPRQENRAVYHTIEFQGHLTLDLEISPRYCLERFVVRKGARVRTQIKPYVEETPEGPVEVADLFFEDGTVTRKVPFDVFSFVE
jgi:hypothetical protein